MENKINNIDAPIPDESHLYEVEPEADMIGEEIHGLISPTPWLDWAKSHLGQHETAKSGHSNPFIVGLFKHTTYRTATDATPWCAAFVSSALELCGFKSAHSASAFAYEKYGTHCEPKPGAIVVFNWGNGKGHVSMVSAVGKTTITALGGNQSDSVRYSTFPRSKAVAFRWPVK